MPENKEQLKVNRMATWLATQSSTLIKGEPMGSSRNVTGISDFVII